MPPTRASTKSNPADRIKRKSKAVSQPPKRQPSTRARTKPSTDDTALPDTFAKWFASRGWAPRSHQLELLDRAAARRSTLLIAPTGAGKTLAGLLPTLVELTQTQRPATGRGVHTLYISPLKALTTDVARNLTTPVEEMGLDVTIETRTGDTSPAKRARQLKTPPDILLTTPEQIALMLSHEGAAHFFGSIRQIVLDELHAIATNKRGDLLALDIARIRQHAPDAILFGLSATVARPTELRAYLEPQNPDAGATFLADLVVTRGGATPDISILESGERLPWSGHSARYAFPELYDVIKQHQLTLVFVNTRSQSELVFQGLWQANDDTLPIALHHGSLDVSQRRKVEAAMAAGQLRAVVCTSALDLGIDWGDVDLVVHVGAPKGSSRLTQRIGRSNHRMDEPSKALLIPANRFEVMECRAALEAAREGAQDTVMSRNGGLDVLAQHVFGVACGGPFDGDALFAEVRSALPYIQLNREQFDRVLDFVATGGYALRAYDRFARMRLGVDGLWRLTHPRFAQQYRLNIGTIVDAPMMKVRQIRARGGRTGKDGKPSGAAGTGTAAAASAAFTTPPGSTGPIRPGLPPTIGARPTPTPNLMRGVTDPAQNQAFAGGKVLGEVDEWFVNQLVPGDTFAFAGQVLRFEGIKDTEVYVSRSTGEPKIPAYQGGKFPMSTSLAERVRRMMANPQSWPRLPDQVREWLEIQQRKSIVPTPNEVLVETFPRGKRHYFICYPFEGRLAHQTLGVLLTRRLERQRARPVGFVANDYAVMVWCARDLNAMIDNGELDLADVFSVDMLGDDLEDWLARSTLMKRTFYMCAQIAGLVERRHPGREKSGRQVTISTNLIFDVLRQHEPGHILLEAAWNDAATGLLDLGRLSDFLERIDGHIRHISLDHVSPFAVPVMLEAGRESVSGEARDELLREASHALVEEAMSDGPKRGK